MNRPGIAIAAAGVVLCVTMSAQAAAVSVPLQGYYHPGRYMPVRFAGQAEASLTFSADGAVTTKVIQPQTGVAPFLVERSAGSIARWSAGNQMGELPQLHPLADDQRLVGFTAMDDSLAAAVFPDRSIISIQLDTNDPLPNAPAWGSLDLAVLTLSQLSRLPAEQRAALLAGGTSLAVVTDSSQPPDKSWPWEHIGSGWVLRSLPPLSVAIADTDDAYAPTSAWHPGRSAAYRIRLVLLAIAFTIIAVGISLWRSKGSIAAIVAAAIVVLVAIGLWDSRQDPVASAGGEVGIVPSAPVGLSRYDDWVFQRSPKPAVVRRPGDWIPVLPRHGGPDSVTLQCRQDGSVEQIVAELAADRPMAWVVRHVTSSPLPKEGIQSTSASPLDQLVPGVYPGFEITERAPASDTWPTIELHERHPKSHGGAERRVLP